MRVLAQAEDKAVSEFEIVAVFQNLSILHLFAPQVCVQMVAKFTSMIVSVDGLVQPWITRSTYSPAAILAVKTSLKVITLVAIVGVTEACVHPCKHVST